MTPSDQTPKLPTWIFIVTDLALLGADLHADVIATRSGHALNQKAVLALREQLLEQRRYLIRSPSFRCHCSSQMQ